MASYRSGHRSGACQGGQQQIRDRVTRPPRGTWSRQQHPKGPSSSRHPASEVTSCAERPHSLATAWSKPRQVNSQLVYRAAAGDGEAPESQEQSVQEALSAAEAALAEAQEKLADVASLPSAREPWQKRVPRPVVKLLKAACWAALVAILWSAQCASPGVRTAGSLAVGALIGLYGFRKGSLSGSGAAAAAVVGGGTLAASFRCGATLLAFYFSSSRLTAWMEERKATDDAFKAGGQRDWVQVLANALIPLLAALALVPVTGGADVPLAAESSLRVVRLLGAFLGYYSCCCGDTWASELGQLSDVEPRLIIGLRPVRKGTNGGVTPLGLGASLAGGLFVGLVFWATAALSPTLTAAGSGHAARTAALLQWRVIPAAACAGLFGSLLDSLLGATVQFTGFNRSTGRVTSRYSSDIVPISGIPLLSNSAVNVISASATAALCSLSLAYVL